VIQCRRADKPPPVSSAVAAVAAALLHFCIQLFDHQLERTDYDSAVLSGLAVLAIKGDGWEDASNYTPKLSAVIKVAQLLVIQYAWKMGRADPAVNVIAETKAMAQRFLQTATCTPVHWMYHLRQYGMVVRTRTSGPGTIEWHGDTIRYRSTIEFSMGTFRSFIHKLIQTAQEQLDKLLMLRPGEERPAVVLAELEDNAAKSEPGWLFIKDERNYWSVDGSRWLMDRVVNDDALQNDWLRGKDGLRWKMDRVWAYMEAVAYFMELLLVLMHITGGQPARSTELLSIRYRNTGAGGRRNIFIEKGLVVYVTEYHKRYGAELFMGWMDGWMDGHAAQSEPASRRPCPVCCTHCVAYNTHSSAIFFMLCATGTTLPAIRNQSIDTCRRRSASWSFITSGWFCRSGRTLRRWRSVERNSRPSCSARMSRSGTRTVSAWCWSARRSWAWAWG